MLVLKGLVALHRTIQIPTHVAKVTMIQVLASLLVWFPHLQGQMIAEHPSLL